MRDDAQARLLALREAFDESWSKPARAAPELVDLLLVAAGASELALRTSELVGVQALSSLTPLPSPTASLIGLTAVRGAIVPVYSAAALLGEALPATPPRWLALARSGRARARHGLVGVAFEALQWRLAADPSALEAHPDGAGRYGLLRHEARVLHVLDLTTLVQHITRAREEP